MRNLANLRPTRWRLTLRKVGGIPLVSTTLSLSVENEQAEPVSRDQIIFKREQGQGKKHYPCSSADHDQKRSGRQPCPVDLYSYESADYTYYGDSVTRCFAWAHFHLKPPSFPEQSFKDKSERI